jgi:hypothetical protein
MHSASSIALVLLATLTSGLQPQRTAPRRPALPQRRPPATSAFAPAAVAALAALEPLPALAAQEGTFSAASYYTTLALYVVSFPGVYSLVTRSVKSKIVRKTYEVGGPAAPGGRATRELAGDIVAFFQANNYKITDAAETIVFEGVQAPLVGRGETAYNRSAGAMG